MADILKIDARRYKTALRAFLSNSRREISVAGREAARDFVSEVIKVTPPNQSGRFNQAAGNRAVRADILKVMAGSTKGDGNPAAVHARYRRRRGRVNTRLKTGQRDRRVRVPRAALQEYVRRRQANVGTLAAGWNPAAASVGARVPNWISRHGLRLGSVRMEFASNRIRFLVTNNVDFADKVAGLTRRVQWAMDMQAKKLERRVANHSVKQAARKAGFRTR